MTKTVLIALAIAEHFWHSVKASSYLNSSPTSANKVGLSKKLEAGIADSNWPEEYLLYDVMVSNKMRQSMKAGFLTSKADRAWRLAGHWSACEGWRVTTSLAPHTFLHLFILTQEFSHFCSSFLFPHPAMRGQGVGSCVGACLLAGVNPPQLLFQATGNSFSHHKSCFKPSFYR